MSFILKGISLEELEKFITTHGYEKYKANQVYTWLYKQAQSDTNSMINLSSKFKSFLNEKTILNTLELFNQKDSQNTTKFLFKTQSNKYIESVSMIENNRHTVCLSSQVGCSVDCDFCATGKMGFIKNLHSGEIIDQLLYIKNHIQHPITNIVFMGMGEPFLNYKNVINAANLMIDPKGLNFAAHRITISTAGILPKINQFINDNLKFNLAISLNATDDVTRNKLMPINKKWPISDLIKIAKTFNQAKKLKITFEYVLIDSVNDSIKDAKKLAQLLRGSNCKLNIIPFNDIGTEYKRPPVKKIEDFLEIIYKECQGFKILVRWSKGIDINAGCGQLATKDMQ